MNNETFNTLLERRINLTCKVLARKSEEYSSSADRLHNFKRAAIIDNVTPAQALKGMYLKHLVSILDMIDSGEKPSQAWIDEKIGDSINYNILLEGIFSDENN